MAKRNKTLSEIEPPYRIDQQRRIGTARLKGSGTTLVPPWVSEETEVREYLSLVEPWPDDFGDPMLIVPAQWATMHERDERATDTPERRIAFAFLARAAADCFFGPKSERIKTIDELRNWLEDEDLAYPFENWCDILGLDPSWARRKWRDFLEQAADAQANGSDYIVVEGRKIPTRTFKLYRSRILSHDGRAKKRREAYKRNKISKIQAHPCSQQLDVGELRDVPDAGGTTDAGLHGPGSGESEAGSGAGGTLVAGAMAAGEDT